MTLPAINLTPVADADSDTVKRRSGGRANPYRDAVAAVAAEHPVISPWYAVPGADEGEQVKALRAIKAAARELERQVLTGKHTGSGAPVWALGGNAQRRQRGGANANVTPEPQNMPVNSTAPDGAKAKARR